VPTYQYACTACGQQLEVVQSFSDAALTECPACEGQLRKVFSAVGIVFKGSGFYRTDSRSSANGSDGSSKESPSKESPSTTSSGSSESTAAKSESSSSSSGSSSSTPTTAAPASSSSSKATPAAV
jgi:putative FmdB family regulatory protein